MRRSTSESIPARDFADIPPIAPLAYTGNLSAEGTAGTIVFAVHQSLAGRLIWGALFVPSFATPTESFSPPVIEAYAPESSANSRTMNPIPGEWNNPAVDTAVAQIDFLSDAADRIAKGDLIDTLASVHGHVLDLLMADRLDECNQLITLVDTDKSDTDFLMSFIVATAGVDLPYRDEFFRQVRDRLVLEIGEPETAETIDRYK